MMNVSINRESSQAIYKQISEQIKTHISSGRLPANSRLPTVRKMAKSLGVTRLTVQNAYSELQADGWVEATVGRGTFVSPSVQPFRLEPTVGQYLTADNTINDLLQINQVVGVRSMAMALPDSALFPLDLFWRGLERVRHLDRNLFNYGSVQGDTPLRLEIVNLLGSWGISAEVEHLLVTSGVMQAIALLSHVLAKPGDTVVIDAPSYIGILSIIKTQGVNAVSVPLEEDGPNLAQLETLFAEQQPRYYYTIPNFHNPTGICMSLAKRQGILELAERYKVMVIEDDIYGRLAFDHAPPPALKSLDEHNRVVYVSGFSKMLLPGLRVGFMVMPPQYKSQLLTYRRAFDLCGPPFLQRALALFLREGHLKTHLKKIIPIYQSRRDALLTALQTHMPSDVSWSVPQGGFCCWVTMPRRFERGELYRMALQHGVAFTPGEAYELNTPDSEHFRLCFGGLPSAAIQATVSQIAALIRDGGQTGGWFPIV